MRSPVRREQTRLCSAGGQLGGKSQKDLWRSGPSVMT